MTKAGYHHPEKGWDFSPSSLLHFMPDDLIVTISPILAFFFVHSLWMKEKIKQGLRLEKFSTLSIISISQRVRMT